METAVSDRQIEAAQNPETTANVKHSTPMTGNEFVESLRDGREVRDLGGRRIAVLRLEPEPAGMCRNQSRSGRRIAGREQCHVVTAPHQLFGQPRDDALGPPVEPRRDALEQWSNLSDPHGRRNDRARAMPVDQR